MADNERLIALVGQLWDDNGHLARERVALLRTHVDRLEQGLPVTPEDREAAIWAAHNLGGALGSYLRQGSAEAGELERLLRSAGSPVSMSRLVAALEKAVSATPDATDVSREEPR